MSKHILLPTAGLTLAALITTGCAAPISGSKALTTPSSSSTSSSSSSTTSSEPVPEPEPVYDTPKASDIVLTLKVVKKKCFGSAGCNVTVKVNMAVKGSPNYDPDKTYAVTFRVTGDESGPIIDTTEITGSNYDVQEEIISTKSSSTKTSVKVVSVEEL